MTIGKWFSDPTVEDMEALRDADADGEIRLSPSTTRSSRSCAAVGAGWRWSASTDGTR